MKTFLIRILLGVAFVLANSAVATAAEKSVVLISADGTQREEMLSNVDRIEIDGGALTLKTTAGDSQTVSYSDLDRVLIGAEVSAVQKLIRPGEIAVWPTVTSGDVNLSGLNAGETVIVYDLKGTIAAKAKSCDGITVVNLGSLSAGAYIVTAGEHSVKIIKK